LLVSVKTTNIRIKIPNLVIRSIFFKRFSLFYGGIILTAYPRGNVILDFKTFYAEKHSTPTANCDNAMCSV
jgi:hypothetical protein